MRNAFLSHILDGKSRGLKIMLLVGDLGYGALEPFVEQYPDSFINVGIAEQNMLGMAAGLASEGYSVFCYSIGNFNTFRAAEQLRNDIDYHKLPVCIVSMGGGVAYGSLGYSHHAIQDYGLVRNFTETTILAPADSKETLCCLDYFHSVRRPCYLRLHRNGEPDIHDDPILLSKCEYVFVLKQDNSSVLVISTGFGGQIAASVAKSGYVFDHVSIPIWGYEEVRSKKLDNLISNYEKILLVEDHLKQTGFGSWFTYLYYDSLKNKCVHIIGFSKDVVGIVGSEDYILGSLGLKEELASFLL